MTSFSSDRRDSFSARVCLSQETMPISINGKLLSGPLYTAPLLFLFNGLLLLKALPLRLRGRQLRGLRPLA